MCCSEIPLNFKYRFDRETFNCTVKPDVSWADICNFTVISLSAFSVLRENFANCFLCIIKLHTVTYIVSLYCFLPSNLNFKLVRKNLFHLNCFKQTRFFFGFDYLSNFSFLIHIVIFLIVSQGLFLILTFIYFLCFHWYLLLFFFFFFFFRLIILALHKIRLLRIAI